MKPRHFLYLLFVFLPFTALAQYEKLLHKPYREKVRRVHAMYKDLIDIPDSVQRAKRVEELKSFAQKHKDRGLELEVHFFQVFWNAFYQKQPKETSLRALKEQLVVVSNENIDFLRARALRALAEFYWKIEQNYELAFEQYLLLDKELATIKSQDYPEMARDLMQIGQAYYFFQDYSLAATYFKKAIKLPENAFNTMVLNDARNTLGLCYQQLNKLDSADYYFNKVQKTSFPEAAVWKRIATGNLGNSMYLRKQYGKAIPLLETDFNGAVAETDNGCAAGAAILLADIFREKGNLEKAGAFIEQAKYHIEKAGQPDRLRLLYPVMSKWYAAKGNIEKSKQYVDSSVVAFNRYNEKFSALKVLRAQQKVDLEKYRGSIQKIDSEKQYKLGQRNLLIAGLVIVLMVSLCGLREQRRKTENKQAALKDAERELQSFHKKIADNNALIETLQTQVSGINEDAIASLQQSTILNEKQWVAFRAAFEKLNPGFLTRLKAKMPDLSPAEIRFVVLTKLQFNHKDMAATLGVGAEAIRQYRLRLRKKLTLHPDTPIEEIVAGI